MNPAAALVVTIASLVHPDANATPAGRAAHGWFIATRLGVSLGALALAPLCLVARAAPAGWEIAVLAWLMLPFAAALHVSRSGDLRIGEGLSIAAWVGLAVTVTLGTGSNLGAALLLMVPLEAAASVSASTTIAGVVTAAVAGLALALLSRHGIEPHGSGVVSVLGCAAFAAALCYGGVLAMVAGILGRLRQVEVRAAQAQYRALCETIDDVVLEFDRAGGVGAASAASARLFALEPHEFARRGFFERLHVADRPLFLKAVAEVSCDGRPQTTTLRLRTGRTVPSTRGSFEEPVFAWVDLALRPPPAAAAQHPPRGMAAMGLLRDASARMEADRTAAQDRSAASKTIAGRDLFLANVSHELRTPLNAIIGFAEMLANDALMPAGSAKRREYAEIIHGSGLHLLAVVNGILDASKIESGSFAIVPEPFDLGALVETCCDMVSLKAEQSSIELRREVAPAEAILGDKRACKQIVLNLLSNALKFTPAGGKVTVGIRPDGTSMLVTVADTGIGIAPRDLPRLGDPFFQASASYDRRCDGTGLGLSVVRGLVGLHGGRLAIESAPGQGTRVTVRLPSDCRPGSSAPDGFSKIETIPRYVSGAKHGDLPGGGRMHEIA